MRLRWMVPLVAAGLLASTAVASADDLVVRTGYGAVRGEASGGTRVFEGIPFAAPPVKDLRWRDPRPPAKWDGVRDAVEPGAACAQLPGESPTGSEEEDCLYLNVTAPAGKHKPVIVWLHGGGYFMGAGSNYYARRFAERGDVVVGTVNYRLGIFGFLGMLGLAGSGLFDKAVMQSGSCATGWLDNFEYRGEQEATIFQPLNAVAAHGADVARELECADVECLRGKEIEKLMPYQRAFIQPAYGTAALPSYPGDAVRDGRFHRVPVLSGTTRDEARPWIAAYEDNGTAAMRADTFETVLAETFGDQAAAVRAVYSPEKYGSAALAWAALVTDKMWSCTQLRTDRGLAARTRVYAYEFADPNPPKLSPLPPTMPLGAQHASELWDFFDLGGRAPKFTPEQQRLSERMIDHWADFAAHGDPGWPRFSGHDALSFAPDAIAKVDLAAEHHCD